MAVLYKYLKLGLLTLVLLSAVPIPIGRAAAGDLDVSFGRGGIVTTNVAEDDGALAVALQPDGKIVAVGYSSPFYQQFALVRYDGSGNLDASFGDGGKVMTDFGGWSIAHAVVIQPDGKIVAAGIASTKETGMSFALARYDRNGALDPSFGSGGKVISLAGFAVNALILQPDGKVVAAGQHEFDFSLARFNSDGSVDAGFGDGGQVVTDFDFGSDEVRALALQADGKIIAAGSRLYNGYSIAVARYNPDGRPDKGFGDKGRVHTAIEGYADSVAIQPDGKIVAAGLTYDRYDFALVRYQPDGQLDMTFGNAGIVKTDMNNSADYAYAVAIQGDGKILAAGYSSAGSIGDFAIARYNANGTLDTTFGRAGKITTNIDSFEIIQAIVIQRDGKILAAGWMEFGKPRRDFALVRYESGLPVPKIVNASRVGKALHIEGENFDIRAVLLINGEEQKTTNDPGNPATRLIAKKAGKRVKPGDTLQVKNPDGIYSPEFVFPG